MIPMFFSTSRNPIAGALIFLAALALLHVGDAPSLAATWQGRVDAPAGVNPAEIGVLLHETPFHEIENDPWEPLRRVEVNARGEFALDCEPTTQTQIEVVGCGVRRARFGWPAPSPASDAASKRSVFRVERGQCLEVQVVEKDSGKPVANALLGPVSPGDETSGDRLRSVYPFFVRTDADGKALLEGLMPDTQYRIPVFAAGYARERWEASTPGKTRITLRRGGLALAGVARGDRSGNPYPHIPIRLTGGPADLHVLRRTDAEGRFRFEGLPEGTYQLAADIPAAVGTFPSEYSVFGNKSLETIWLPVPEGINLMGMVTDRETGLPIERARVAIRDRYARTDVGGRFEMTAVTGPWPVRVHLEHPDYTYSEEDQAAEMYPLESREGSDIADLVLVMRKKRFLDVRLSGLEPTPLPTPRPGAAAPMKQALARLTLWGPFEEKGTESRTRELAERRTVLGLESAGTRAAFARTPAGDVSELTFFRTALDATTTTLYLQLGPGARLEGSLSYREGPPPPAYRLVLLGDFEEVLPEPFEYMSVPPDSEGQFRLAGLPPGTFLVRFLTPEGQVRIEERVTLQRGEVVRLDRRIDRGLTLAGRVIDNSGKALGEIPLSAYGKDPEGNGLHRKTMSGDDGRFRLEGFRGPELDELRVEHHFYKPLTLSKIALPDENYEVVLTERVGITIEVPAPASSLVAARAFVLGGNLRTTETAPDQWFYDIESQTPFAGESSITVYPKIEGRLRVAVEADREWDVSPAIEWDPTGAPVRLQLTPGRTGRLVARLQGIESEDEVARLDVVLINTALPESEANVEFASSTRSASEMTFEGIPAGEYLLLVSERGSGLNIARTNIDLASGQTAEVIMNLGPEAREFELRGIVVELDDSGKKTPLAGASVTLYFGDIPEPEVLAEDTTHTDGGFSFPALPPRRPYLIEARHGSLEHRRMISPRETSGKTATVEIVLRAAVSVRLVVSEGFAEKLRSAPSIPILVQHKEGTSSVTVFFADLEKPVLLAPGEYSVFWGETALGGVDVLGGGDVRLPDPPNSP